MLLNLNLNRNISSIQRLPECTLKTVETFWKQVSAAPFLFDSTGI